MKRIAVTGAIGSGKSFVCREIEALGVPVFNCDDEARRLMAEDGTLRERVTALVGSDEKSALRAFVARGGENVEKLNALVHPCVRKSWEDFCAAHATEKVVVMECALLFESRMETLVDKTVCVVAPEDTRIRRVMQRDGVDEKYVRDIMKLQMTQEEKMNRADIVFKNF